jgi:hypothetical protein
LLRKLRQHWFGLLLTISMLLFFALVVVVMLAPHNDDKQRGFAPCTYEMSEKLNFYSVNRQIFNVFGAIMSSYACYLNVVGDGFKLWYDGKQKTPWDNYFFEPVTMDIPKELSEPFSKELMEANMLNEEDGDIFNFKENIDEQK